MATVTVAFHVHRGVGHILHSISFAFTMAREVIRTITLSYRQRAQDLEGPRLRVPQPAGSRAGF